jgi:hypothetical protein
LAIGIVLSLALLGYIVSALIHHAGWGLLLTGVCAVLVYVACRMLNEHDRLRRLAAGRKRESICTFVRHFDCRAFDTWVLRATYETLSAWMGIPLRPDDRLAEDLGIETEDLHDLGDEIAWAAGRLMDDASDNPWCGQVETVADVCQFMMCQPRLAAAAA